MTTHYASRKDERAAVEARRRAYHESRCRDPYHWSVTLQDKTYGGIIYCQRDKGHEASRKPAERTHHANGLDW